MNTLITIGVLGFCMAIMAIGAIVKGKPICKDCGLDPETGDRIGHCHCADEGPEPAGKAAGCAVIQFPERPVEDSSHSSV